MPRLARSEPKKPPISDRMQVRVPVLPPYKPPAWLCLPKTLSGMTVGWSCGNEATDGRVSDPAVVCCPVSTCAEREALQAENSPAPTTGSSAAQVPDARRTVEHRSLAVGMAVSTIPIQLLDAIIIIVQPETDAPLAPKRFSALTGAGSPAMSAAVHGSTQRFER